MKPRGWVRDPGTNARDYVWIMARTPQMDPVDYQRLLDAVGALGYDKTKVKQVPQRWP